MQRVGIAQAGTRFGDMVDDDEDAAGFQRGEHCLVQHRRIGRTHEGIGIVVVVLRGEHHVHRLGCRQRRGGLDQHLDIAVARLLGQSAQLV